MAFYEQVCIARPDLSTSQVDGLKEKCASILENNGGRVVDTEYWGAKRLAYRIKKNRKGHYLFLKIESPTSAVQELERLLRIDEDVIRFLTIRVDAHSDEPSAMMKAKAQRKSSSGRRQ
ncbi:MAG: 30S ribosomal protein S6 [Rhodobacteraceae bacterium]|nr:30S ribosomal protein S6 [Paracoccaceae bacterium]